MRYLLFFIVMAFSFCPCGADEKQDALTLKAFVNEHPKCMKTDVVYDGCSLMLCSDGEYLFAQFNILHPAMQMRILMQGLTFYVDPTGKRKEKYAIIFPSAGEIQDMMDREGLNPSTRQQSAERPDISPLISSLQGCGAIYDVKGKTSVIKGQMFSIVLSENKNVLSYSVLIPINDILKEKKVSQIWSIGLYSEGGRKDSGGPALENRSMERQPAMEMRDGITLRDDQEEMRKILSRDIESWTKFSLEKICSLND